MCLWGRAEGNVDGFVCCLVDTKHQATMGRGEWGGERRKGEEEKKR